MRLPLTVWLPPMMLMGVTSDAADYMYVLTMGAVYCVMVSAHLVAIKMELLGAKADAKKAARAALDAKEAKDKEAKEARKKAK